MIIGNLLGRTKIACLSNSEVSAWEAEIPLDGDIVFNTSKGSFQIYDETAGASVLYQPVTTWKIDDDAPASGSTVTYSETIDKTILLFALTNTSTGVSRLLRVLRTPATNPSEVEHSVNTGLFTLYSSATPATEFNSEWLTIIYNNEVPAS
jgi:hypothetical protein